MIGTTITQHLIEEQRSIATATGDLTSVINDIVTACKTIANAMRYGALAKDDIMGVSSNQNVQGETQKKLDILANELFLQRTELGGHVAAMVSEEMESVHHLPGQEPKGRYLLLYDPVDGSSNIDENATIGTIFSILKRPDGATGRPDSSEFLQTGDQQVCAGYAIYGSSCMIVMTTGNGVNGFTLDPQLGEFILSHPNIIIPASSPRFYINMAMSDHWDEPVRAYIDDCRRGAPGVGGRVFDQRWSAGAVADIHRVLMAGGIYFNPSTELLRQQGLPGKLRLLYEVSPLGFMVEQAGGLAITGDGNVLEVVPESLHQRCPAVMGSSVEVSTYQSEYLAKY